MEHVEATYWWKNGHAVVKIEYIYLMRVRIHVV
jgi:hypothetical protein